MGDIEIQVWTPEQKKLRCDELLETWLNFCRYEPMNAAIKGLLNEGNNRKGLASVLKDMMSFDDMPLVVAWDKSKQQVAGFLYGIAEFAGACSDETQESVYSFSKYNFEPDTLKKLDIMVGFLKNLAKKADVFNKYGVDKTVSIQVTSVCQEYMKRGIANNMTAKFLEVVKEKGFQIVTAESTSAYTQHNKIKTFQFEKVIEANYADVYTTFADMPDDMKNEHKTATILVKKI